MAKIVGGNFFRETGEFTVQIPALPRPTLAQIQAAWPFVKDIESDVSPTEAVTLRLGTVLQPHEPSITGPEYEQRLRTISGCWGLQQGLWLRDHQDDHPAFKALIGQIYIDLTALIVVDEDGSRWFPYLGGRDRRWDVDWDRFDGGLAQRGRVAASGKA